MADLKLSGGFIFTKAENTTTTIPPPLKYLKNEMLRSILARSHNCTFSSWESSSAALVRRNTKVTSAEKYSDKRKGCLIPNIWNIAYKHKLNRHGYYILPIYTSILHIPTSKKIQTILLCPLVSINEVVSSYILAKKKKKKTSIKVQKSSQITEIEPL